MSDTLKKIAENYGAGLVNGSYLNGIAEAIGVDLTTSTDLMRDILAAIGGNPESSTDYLQDIVIAYGGYEPVNGNWMEAWEAITATPPVPAPVNTVLPEITGTPIPGNQLATTDGTWDNSPTSYAYQWMRGATNIGDNQNAYTLVNDDRGQSITCVVTATNAGGSTPATSNALEIPNLFTTTWTTTADAEMITLPYTGVGTYTGTIDWGDGNTDVNDGTVTNHTYATAGTYTVIIDGTCIVWDFKGLGGSTYITSVVHWGQVQKVNFGFCPNLDLSSVSDIIDLTGTEFNQIFRGCSSLTTINRINEWDTSAVTDMIAMFRGCSLFNQALTFDTSAVTKMNSMFRDATAFDQNIGTWDVANVTDFSGFMVTKTPATFSTTNLDAIYNGWSTQAVQSSLSIDFGTAEYTAAAAAGRLVLTGTALWTINDGGQV
jgi:surface protein